MAQRDITDEREYLEDRRAWRERGLSRRDLLRAGAAGALVLGGAGGMRLAQASAQAPAPPIAKPLPPEWFIPIGTNAEMRWEAMAGQGYVTPASASSCATTPRRRGSIRARGGCGSSAPGCGARRASSVEPAGAPAARLGAAHGGDRVCGQRPQFLHSQQGTPTTGSQWGLGAVGVARWRGVPLGAVLDRAGITRRAVDVMPEGLDATVVSDGVDQGHVRRPLPVGKALDDVLLAYEMNGAPLPPDHGAPVRLVVPGWVGIASIKWLGRIEVSDQPLFSAWNTTQYRMTGGDYPTDSPPLTTQPVKSAFELPLGATLPAARRIVLHGRSWSGAAAIRRVEVRVDGDPDGAWRRARLHGPNLPQAWVRWSVDWRPPAPGAYGLLARATDRTGTTQPDTVPFNANGYQFWAVARHPVTVA